MEDVLEPGVKKAGIERRNLQALAIGCALIALVAVLGLKMVAAVFNLVLRLLPTELTGM